MRVGRYTFGGHGRFSAKAWVRSAWLLVTLIGLYALALASPELWRSLTTVCTEAPCEVGQPTPEGLAALARLGLSPLFYALSILAANLLVPGVILLVMGLLVWKKPQDRTVALLAFAGVTCSLIGSMTTAAQQQPWLEPALRGFWLVAGAGFALGLLSFPDGRFVPGWSRFIAYGLALAPIFIFIPGLHSVGEGLAFAAFMLTFPLALILLSLRYRRADGVQRQQIKWVLYSIGVMVAATVVNGLFYGPLPNAWVAAGAPGDLFTTLLGSGSIVFFWLCIAVSVYRYRLFDIDLIIRRTLVYSALTAGVTALYLALVAGAGALAGPQDNLLVSLLATGVVATAFQPLRVHVQRGVNRLLYGYRHEPYRVLAELGARLEGALEPQAILPLTVETVAEALKLPYAAVVLEGGVVAARGAPQGREEDFAFSYAGERLGELVVSPRASEESLGRADRRLLADLARQIGAAAHALLLQADLERSRLRLISAREEARRRLGNDLHDSVGHQLAGLARRAEAAGNLLESDPDSARSLLADLVAESRGAILHVRALAHQLHPPELEVLGLAGALREKVETALAGGLRVTFEADELPRLPAAVEVAAYYIAQEALCNALRHAGATACHVRLRLVRDVRLTALAAPVLELSVSDDGCGLAETAAAGLGLSSMRERAAEVGGCCHAQAAAGGGTRVLAQLPCPAL